MFKFDMLSGLGLVEVRVVGGVTVLVCGRGHRLIGVVVVIVEVVEVIVVA